MRTKCIMMLLLRFFSLQTNAQTEKYVEKYDDGQIRKVCYRNKIWGYRGSFCINYAQDGTFYSGLSYQEKNLRGTPKFYNKFGKIETIINYDSGRLGGKSTIYRPIQSADETPTIYFAQIYHDDGLDGMTYEYDKNGKDIIRRARYSHDICMADATITNSGVVYKYRSYDSDYEDPMTSHFVPFKEVSATPNKSKTKSQKRTAITRATHSSSSDNTRTTVSSNTLSTQQTKRQATTQGRKSRLEVNKDGAIGFG